MLGRRRPDRAAATRRLAVPLVLLAAFATGCGGDDRDKYAESYRPLNDRLLQIGRDVPRGLAGAAGKTNKQLSEQFARFALQLRAVNKEIRRLDTPGDLEDESQTLTERIDDTVRELEALSGATGLGDRGRTAVAIVDYYSSAEALNRAQNRLAEATGTRVGPR